MTKEQELCISFLVYLRKALSFWFYMQSVLKGSAKLSTCHDHTFSEAYREIHGFLFLFLVPMQ